LAGRNEPTKNNTIRQSAVRIAWPSPGIIKPDSRVPYPLYNVHHAHMGET
jgi:hypothetical protein